MVNIHLMYEPITQIMLGAKADASLLHVISESFVKFFFEGKFYVIFSMLFGFGFFVFMNKIAESPDTVLPLFRRRLFFLLLFGLAHITLLWAGDVFCQITTTISAFSSLALSSGCGVALLTVKCKILNELRSTN